MKKTKAQKALEALEAAGEEGIHSFDMVKIAGLRCAARILDLRKLGKNIQSVIERKGGSTGCRYILQG